MTTIFRRVLAVVVIAVYALAPSFAEARAGGSISGGGSSGYSSMGSMGSRTYQSSPGAAPVQRSLTPNTPNPGTNPGYAQPNYGGYPRNSFLSGLGAGLFGAWIGSMLFGHSGYGAGYDGMQSHGGGIFGTLLMLLFFFWIGRMIWRNMSGFSGRGNGIGSAASFFSPAGQQQFGGYGSVPNVAQPVLALADADLNEFTGILSGVQTAWANGDLNAMRRFATPEMLSYFSEELASNASQGYVNRVSNVTLLKGEPRDSWSEGSVDYASAYLQWSAIDYNERLDHSGAIVAGSPTQPVTAAEIWTFRRASGGRWMLSAIQQLS